MITFASFRNVKQKVVLPTRLIPLINSFSGLLASLIIFGYLGYFCKKFNLDLQQLPISGPGLLFITFPACLSTMEYSNFWVILFFVMMIFIGIDSQFGIVETFCYLIEDVLEKYYNEPPNGEKVKAYVCLGLFLIGIPLSTGAGLDLMNLMDTFSYSLPACLANALEIYIWAKLTSFSEGATRLLKVTGEGAPPSIDMYCLETTSFWVASFMFALMLYLSIQDGIVLGGFTIEFFVVGLISMILVIFPSIWFYIKFYGKSEFHSKRRSTVP